MRACRATKAVGFSSVPKALHLARRTTDPLDADQIDFFSRTLLLIMDVKLDTEHRHREPADPTSSSAIFSLESRQGLF